MAGAGCAGAVRRANRKGLGEARGCNPPGTPMHKPLNAPVLTENDVAAPSAVLSKQDAALPQRIEVNHAVSPPY